MEYKNFPAPDREETQTKSGNPENKPETMTVSDCVSILRNNIFLRLSVYSILGGILLTLIFGRYIFAKVGTGYWFACIIAHIYTNRHHSPAPRLFTSTCMLGLFFSGLSAAFEFVGEYGISSFFFSATFLMLILCFSLFP